MTDNNNARVELLPCPFCNFQVDEYSFGQTKPERRWEVFCRSCDSAGRPCNTKEEAAKAWNRRPAPPTRPEAAGENVAFVEELRNAAKDRAAMERETPGAYARPPRQHIEWRAADRISSLTAERDALKLDVITQNSWIRRHKDELTTARQTIAALREDVGEAFKVPPETAEPHSDCPKPDWWGSDEYRCRRCLAVWGKDDDRPACPRH
jgi:hypothetical protein